MRNLKNELELKDFETPFDGRESTATSERDLLKFLIQFHIRI